VGSQPLGAVVIGPSASPEAYVANNGDGTVSVVDLSSLRVIDTVFIGGRPRGTAAIGSQGSQRVLVTN
jgi:YVTN family beta-propeller protein